MSNPVDPNSPGIPPAVPPASPTDGSSYSSQGKPADYSQAWAKMLPGASPAQIHAFMEGVLKALSVTIQQNQRIAARAAREMKRAIKGD